MDRKLFLILKRSKVLRQASTGTQITITQLQKLANVRKTKDLDTSNTNYFNSYVNLLFVCTNECASIWKLFLY